MAIASALVGLTLIVAQQVITPSSDGNAIVSAPSDSSSQTTTNVTNVFPPPDPQYVIQTEQQGAPVILQSALQSIDTSGSKDLVNALDLGLQLAQLRKDLILTPAVQELNDGLQRIVFASLALVIAALCLWGMLGQLFGSDGREAFEAIGRVPLWCILALTSLAWYSLLLDGFAALGGVIASSAHGAFGPILRDDFWSNQGLSLFSAFTGLFLLLVVLWFIVKLFANTAFLALCAIVAPVFIFLKCTPWTSSWGDRWFRMVPAAAGDLLAMLTMMVIGSAALDHLELSNTFETIAFELGLLLAIPLVEELFGVRGSGIGGGRIWDVVFLGRLRRALSASQVVRQAAPPSNPSRPTRAPRWTTP
jgi:hypothetical protein